VHPALKEAGPYVVVLVELPHAGGIRMRGNLVGDQHNVSRSARPSRQSSSSTTSPSRRMRWCNGE